MNRHRFKKRQKPPEGGINENTEAIQNETGKLIQEILRACIQSTHSLVCSEEGVNADSKQINPIHKLVITAIIKNHMETMDDDEEPDYPIIGLEDFDPNLL